MRKRLSLQMCGNGLNTDFLNEIKKKRNYKYDL